MSLSLRFRQQLAMLVQAYDEGCGPIEREAVQRLATGLPMTALQIQSFAKECYPAEVRNFLDAQGYQALLRRDLDRALALGTGGVSSPTATSTALKGEPRRRDRRTRRRGKGLRIVVLAAALLAGGLILTTALPKLRGEAEEPSRPPETVVTPPSAPASPPSPCVQALRDGATAWCESALTGSVVRGPGADLDLTDCGDRLTVNSDTVRFTLDQIFQDEATYTYGYAEVRERCAAAAKLAAP